MDIWGWVDAPEAYTLAAGGPDSGTILGLARGSLTAPVMPVRLLPSDSALHGGNISVNTQRDKARATPNLIAAVLGCSRASDDAHPSTAQPMS